jgi:hypothetical protein
MRSTSSWSNSRGLTLSSSSPHPEELAQASVSKDGANDWASWFERALIAPFATASLSLGLLGRARSSP